MLAIATAQVIEAMQRDPVSVLRVVLPRLRLKEAEWRQVGSIQRRAAPQ
jgi:histone deacetylase complex regulatory component SIN3